MDFISKLLQRKPSKQGGCGSSNSIASTPVIGSEHKKSLTAHATECETPVHFTREFVEELVENVHKSSDKTSSDAPCYTVEDKPHLNSVGQEPLPGSLPDLLLPEAAFKKQTDTDTDTTEYESAAETDPPDGLSRSGSLITDDVILSDEAAHESVKTPVSQINEVVESTPTTGDISILCDGLKKLNLDTPEREGTTFTLIEKYEDELKSNCDADHSLHEEIFSENVDSVPSEKELTRGNVVGVCVNELQEPSASVTELLEVRNQEQNLNADRKVCISNSDFTVVSCHIPEQLYSAVNVSSNCIKNEQTSAVFKPASDIPVHSEHNVYDITTSVIETNTEIFKELENRSQNQDNFYRVQSDPKLVGDPKGVYEQFEEPVNFGDCSVNVTECGLCPNKYNSVSLELKLDAASIYDSDSGVTEDLCPTEIPSDLLKTGKPVVNSTLVFCQNNTIFPLKDCDSSCTDTKQISQVVSSTSGAGDSQITVCVEATDKQGDLEKFCSPLQGGGDTQQKDKDYKLYESIIEISRLQEKDLEKEYGVGSTVKADSTESEETDIGNAFCCTPVLNDFVTETQEFGNISSEAEKVADEIFNVSQEIEEELNEITVTNLKYDIEDHIELTMEDRIDPFLPKSALRHSPPPSQRSSSPICSKSRGSSPAKKYGSEKSSPKIRPKSMLGTTGNEKNLHSIDTIISRTRASETVLCAAKSNETLINVTPEKPSIESTEDVLRSTALSAEENYIDPVPDVPNDCKCTGEEVFRVCSGEDFLLSDSMRQKEEDLRRDSLVAKFDPLSITASKTDDSARPVSPHTGRNTSERRGGRPVTPDCKSNSSEFPIPNQALAYIDKLISLSPTASKPEKSTEVLKDQSHSHINHSKLSNSEKECLKDFDKPQNSSPWNSSSSEEKEAMLNELQELRDMVIKQEQSYSENIKLLENKIDSLEIKLKEKEDRECKLNKKITELTEGQEQISVIMEEYERTIARLVLEKEQEKQAFQVEKENLIKDKETVSEHLANIEIAFSDVHRKYERSKDVIQGIKSNEETLRASLAEYEATIKQQEQKYDLLKSYATSQLESANQELESLRRSHQAECAKLTAMLKKAEVKTSSLEEMVEQKVKENQELAAICDELIGKVGSSE